FYTDRRGFVARVQYNGHDRSVQPTISKWITGLNDPWTVRFVNNELVVWERGGRIARWSADTANTKIADVLVVDQTGWGFVEPTRRTWTFAAGKTTTLARSTLKGLAFEG